MLENIGKKAKAAERVLMTASTGVKNQALSNIAKALIENSAYIIEQNKTDIENARANGMSESMIDRLTLTEERIEGISKAVLQIVSYDDPCGKVINGTERPNGLLIEKVAVPMGVIAVIFEARPNVTVDAAALCLKSGNSVILRGGKEAINYSPRRCRTYQSLCRKFNCSCN